MFLELIRVLILSSKTKEGGGLIMNNKITVIIEILKSIEERAYRVGFDPDDAKQHTSLIKELKLECDANNLDCKELVKTLPLANIDFTSLSINC
jgi:hypothetical protein